MSSSFRAPPAICSDDVDLFALIQVIWKQKITVIFIAAAFGVIAAAYAFSVTPEYQVSSVLRPPAINELDALNRSEIYNLPPGQALLKVGAALESYDTRLGFFRANQNFFAKFERPGRTLEQSFEEFNRNSIKLVLPDPKKVDSLSSFIKLEMSYPKGIDGVDIVNNFVGYAIASEREQISADLKVIVQNRLNEIKGKLDSARADYEIRKEARIADLKERDEVRRTQLQDELMALRSQLRMLRANRIAQLNEAIGIAKSLGIKKPSTPSLLGDASHTGSSTVMRAEINNQQIPLYFMGVDALEAERSALLQRKSDDFTEQRIAQIARELQLLQKNREIEVLGLRENEDLFLAGVEPLRAEEARLRNLNMDMSQLKLVTIDKQALEPLNSVKPQKTFIMFIGLMLGALLGIGFVLMRYFNSVRQYQDIAQAKDILAQCDKPASTGSKKNLQKNHQEV